MADNRKDELKEYTEMLEKGVKEFYTSERFTNFLDYMSRFHNYSLSNQILIAMQRKDATMVAGYMSWQRNFKRRVMRGEKGIKILAPQKRQIEIETDKADENGNAIIEKREIITFRPVTVFDVSQTEGEPVPTLIDNLQGNLDNFEKLKDALIDIAPMPVSFDIDTGSANGFCSFSDNIIAVKPGMSELQTVKTLVHEIAHARLHRDSNKDIHRKEIEAEGTAYVVLKQLGFDTSDYSFGYVSSWAFSQKSEVLMESLEDINKESGLIINELTEKLSEIQLPAGEKEYETKALQRVEDSLGDMGNVAFAKVIEIKPGDIPEVKVLVKYTGEAAESDIYEDINSHKDADARLKIIPAGSYRQTDDNKELPEEPDTTWPMINVSYSSYKDIQPMTYNIMEANELIHRADARLLRAGMRDEFLKIKVAYTFRGQKKEFTDTVNLGRARNTFIDYLDAPPDVVTYLKRHVQILDTLHKAVTVNRVSAKGSLAQNTYEDMMHEWGEKMRARLNHCEGEPGIEKPPEFDEKLVKQYERWEVAR